MTNAKINDQKKADADQKKAESEKRADQKKKEKKIKDLQGQGYYLSGVTNSNVLYGPGYP